MKNVIIRFKMKKRKNQQPNQPPKSELGKIRKVNKGEIVHEIGRLSIDELRTTLIASELSRREGWKNFYESQKVNAKLKTQLAIEQKRAHIVCPICYELMTNSALTSTEFCGHTFHKACVDSFPDKGCPLNCK